MLPESTDRRRDRVHNDRARGGGGAIEVFLAFLRLGLTSFGGPVAHLGYFRAEFVARRRWLDEAGYADIVALCQFLPGPASSQVALTLGLLRAGLAGGLAAWAGFSFPSAAAMIAFAYGLGAAGAVNGSGWLHGLKIVAVAVVAQAVWSMARSLCPDRPRMTVAVAACLLALAMPSAVGQVGAIVAGGLIGWRMLGADAMPSPRPLGVTLGRRGAIGALVGFFVLLFGLPVIAPLGGPVAAAFAGFFRAGALVFGGGHVVLPLLQQAVVPPGWVSNDVFLAGYGAAQAVPGPLFTFSAYLGAAMRPPLGGWLGGLICLVAIYLPSFLLLLGVLPFWDRLRAEAGVQAALRGVNAAVVGLLLAAFYSPVWTSAIGAPRDFGLALAALLALAAWKLPPWLVVIAGALGGAMLAA